jgi:hypothetical protein
MGPAPLKLSLAAHANAAEATSSLLPTPGLAMMPANLSVHEGAGERQR